MLKTETLILLRQGFHLRQGYDVTRRRGKQRSEVRRQEKMTNDET